MDEIKTMWRIYVAVVATLVLAVAVVSCLSEDAKDFSFTIYFLAPLFISLVALFCWPGPLCMIGKSRIVVNHPFCGP